MIRKLLGLVFNRWVLIAVLLGALSMVVWIVGPELAIGEKKPLETESSRWMTIGILVGLVALRMAWSAWQARRGNATVVRQLLAAAPAEREEHESPDLAAVRQRFEQAMLTLRRARFGAGGLVAGWKAKFSGRYLYELPWYLIIGAPGSGKTTALRHCGLNFPVAANPDKPALRGVGGTRHCDWWFTDQAVLIDTAGRFTTQDSDRDNDRATWGGFLAMLKRARPRQPVNGVLVTVSVTDLLTRSAAERREHAETVRKRLQELHEDLNVRFPIYLLVTKTDLLAGFMDYFAMLDKDQRATPWGATFDLKQGTTQGLERFGAEFDALTKRLDDGLIERLQGERDPQRRARIYGFANQFAALRPTLQEFMETVFSPSPYEAEPMLRGAYFVSGTQEGTPIDRVLGAVARSYRLERAVVAPNQASGKSFFLARLLGEVVFAESGLAGTNLKWERRRTALALGGYAAIGLVTLAVLALFGISYAGNGRYVDEVSQHIGQVARLVEATPNRATPDLLPIVPALDATRGLAARDQAASSWKLGFGLNQEPKLDSASRLAYQRMLHDAVLPRLALRVEEQLREAGVAQDSEYEALKTYLMLGDADRFDGDALRSYFERDWDRRFGRSIDAAKRARLSEHLQALLTRTVVSPLPEDKALIEFNRGRMRATGLPQRIYDRLRHDGLGNDYPAFDAVKVAGASADLVFTRDSGTPLQQGVPGLFSYRGYHEGFQKKVDGVAVKLAEEQSWVLGVAATPGDVALQAIDGSVANEVRRLYLNDYAANWETYIADLRLRPMAKMNESMQMAQLLSAPDSPLPPLMKAISRETTLIPADGSFVGTAINKGNDAIHTVTDKVLSSLRKPVPATASAASLEQTLVDDRFQNLRRITTTPAGGKAPVDESVALIGKVYAQLTVVDAAVKSGAVPPPSPIATEVKTAAADSPEPIKSMLTTLATASAHIGQILVRENLSGEVKSQVGEFCQQAIAGRYPLDRNSATDATPADFASLFGPGGKIDQLFGTRLATYVDSTKRPWRFRDVEGGPLGTDVGSLPQFQRAQAIRETFFPAGAATLRLQFKPIEMDASLKQFILDVDGQIVRYDHGPQIPAMVQWPGPRGTMEVRVEVSPPQATGASGMVQGGPWALFRLFDRVQIDPTDAPERFRATFDVDGRKAVFEVTTSSVRNPFRLRELSEFSCPSGL